MEHQAKIKDYDTKIQQALDSATPEGKELADRLSYAKQSYLAHSPWGSEGNHPGVLGKIAHGLARTGEIAADIAMPGLTQAIPGTPERMAREQAGTQGNIQADTALASQEEKPKGTPAEQVYAAHIAAGETPDQALAASEVKPAAQAKEQTTENRLADASVAIENAKAALAKNPNDQVAKDALDRATVEQKATTAAINAKAGSGEAAPATPEDRDDYKNRIATALSGMPEGTAKADALKTYGTAPAGATKAELDKREAQATKFRTMADEEAKTKIAEQARKDAQTERELTHATDATKKEIAKHDSDYVKPAQASQKSFDMMDHAYQEYLNAKAQGKDLPTGAQSMVALSTHLATTFGNVKGARITKDMIQEHLGARGVSDKALVAFQRLTNGDVLSPDQWAAFHDLINTSRTENWKTAVTEATRKKLPVDFLPDDLTAVHVPGHSAGVISTGSLAAFQKKYPDAAVINEPK
jgi:hypothetical protein